MRQLANFLVIFSAFYFIQAQETTDTPVPDFCSLAQDGGDSSDGNFKIYLYYDINQDKCFPFKYYGSGGNDNRFKSEKYCMRNCSAKATTLYPTQEKEACHLPKTLGECLGHYLRFYYDSVHQKCKSFQWTGCVGNGNRFLDIQTCNNTCYGINDPGEGPEEEEYDTPIGVIVGAVIGVLGGAILITVIVLAVKSKGKKAKKSPKETDTMPPLQDERIEMS